MKEVYAYQEVRSDIEQGETIQFTLHPTLYVRAIRKNPDSEVITVTYDLCIGGESIGVFASECANMERLLYELDIADHEEIFEIVEL
jgi:hypothetical protein